MQVLSASDSMRAWSLEHAAQGLSVGLVPTMGALHEGHLSLARASAEQNDVTVMSIFVNPAQFAPHEDFDQYPRAFHDDCEKAEAVGVDAVYAPEMSGMYPDGYATYVQVEGLQDGLCGGSRPHFFRGVATVVTKLFNAVRPTRAYFGQKDGQQAAILTRLARDLDFGIEIVVLPIVRDPDGLAMSSRNQYLSDDERACALCIPKSLDTARKLLASGERNSETITGAVRDGLASVDIDYVSLVDADDMTPVDEVDGKVMLAVAAKVGETRLIDNILYEVQ